MRVKQIYEGLYLYTFPNQYQLSSTFIRLQEYYESQYKQIRGKYFSLEKYMDIYAKDYDNKFTYFEDWNGFNVPGNIVRKFINTFSDRLLDKELTLLDDFICYNSDEKYYIIGCIEKDVETVKHEVAHGLYYLNKEYKKEMDDLIKQLPNRVQKRINKYLLSIGYAKTVLKDETHAYLSTGAGWKMISILNKIIYTPRFRKVFKKYYKDVKNV